MTRNSIPPQRFYDEEKARAYRERSASRKTAEARLVRKALEGIERCAVLDAPCGEGRMLRLLREMGFRPYGLDFSPAMLRLAGGGIRARLQALPFKDRAFPLLFCHRFLHHLPPAGQEEALREMARVAGRRILLSFFHPLSLHGIQRRLLCAVTGRKTGRFSTSPARLKALLGKEGFRPRLFLAQAPFFREFHLALFEREETY